MSRSQCPLPLTQVPLRSKGFVGGDFYAQKEVKICNLFGSREMKMLGIELMIILV